jgi:hypothetical protein
MEGGCFYCRRLASGATLTPVYLYARKRCSRANIVHDRNPHLAEVFNGRRFKEVLILRTKNVRLTDDRGLHHDNVVHVADWRHHQRIQRHNFGRTMQELADNEALSQVR